MDVFPDFGGVGAAGDLRAVIGALLIAPIRAVK